MMGKFARGLAVAMLSLAFGQAAATDIGPVSGPVIYDGTVFSAGGTDGNKISIANGGITNAMLAGSIAASKLIGTDIATVGTITSGIWQGTKIAIAYGGTNATSFGTTNGVVTYDGSKLTNGSGLIWDGSTLSVETSNTDTIYALNSGMSNAGIEHIWLGKALSSGQAAGIFYTYNSGTPANSYLSFTVYGALASLFVDGNGRVGVGTTPGLQLLTVAGTFGMSSSSDWVATSNCGSLSSSTKCLRVYDPNGNPMYFPGYGTY